MNFYVQYKCYTCSNVLSKHSFRDNSFLILLILIGYSVIPKPSSVNECPVCAVMFRKRQVLRNHLAEVHRDTIIQQPEDNDPLDPKSKSKKKGDPLELVTCSFCKKVLASNSNLKKHLAVHKGKISYSYLYPKTCGYLQGYNVVQERSKKYTKASAFPQV